MATSPDIGFREVSWSEMSPDEHFVQIYDDQRALMGVLEGFVADGLSDGEAVILIATCGHLRTLENQLREKGFDIDFARLSDQYIPLDASETLRRFMVDDWPDEMLFQTAIGSVIKRARQGGRKVRAFGEMVALLSMYGQHDATMRLEQLWNQICKKELLLLFCAYPKIAFDQDAPEFLSHVCMAHSKVLPA